MVVQTIVDLSLELLCVLLVGLHHGVVVCLQLVQLLSHCLDLGLEAVLLLVFLFFEGLHFVDELVAGFLPLALGFLQLLDVGLMFLEEPDSDPLVQVNEMVFDFYNTLVVEIAADIHHVSNLHL